MSWRIRVELKHQTSPLYPSGGRAHVVELSAPTAAAALGRASVAMLATVDATVGELLAEIRLSWPTRDRRRPPA